MIFDPANLHAEYVNLDNRPDRRAHMEAELKRVGISATRLRAYKPSDYRGPRQNILKMLNRTPGAIGCMLSQMKVMENALHAGKHALVLEDDVIWADDIHARLDYIAGFLNCGDVEWDVMYLNSTVHLYPEWHKDDLGRDIEPTIDPRIFRTYGQWGTYAYVVNHASIERVLRRLNEFMPESIGIDYSMIKLSQEIRQYCFMPGSTFQIDSRSSIGNGMTIFSHFMKMGDYVFWRGSYLDFDPQTVLDQIKTVDLPAQPT